MIRLNEDGSVTFEFYRAEAQRVAVAGTFNAWCPASHPMQRDDRGLWSIRLDHLEPGHHEFKYVVDGRDWYPDFAAHGVEMDDSGNWRSLLTVAEVEKEPLLQFRGAEDILTTAFSERNSVDASAQDQAEPDPHRRRAA